MNTFLQLRVNYSNSLDSDQGKFHPITELIFVVANPKYTLSGKGELKRTLEADTLRLQLKPEQLKEVYGIIGAILKSTEGLQGLANDMNEIIVKNATCSYEGCNEPTHSNGVCKAHYAELRYPANDDEQ